MVSGSLPVRGAWIEIPQMSMLLSASPSLPVRGAWIEMGRRGVRDRQAQSLPVRGAWIEIAHINCATCCVFVAPRAGSVD